MLRPPTFYAQEGGLPPKDPEMGGGDYPPGELFGNPVPPWSEPPLLNQNPQENQNPPSQENAPLQENVPESQPPSGGGSPEFNAPSGGYPFGGFPMGGDPQAGGAREPGMWMGQHLHQHFHFHPNSGIKQVTVHGIEPREGGGGRPQGGAVRPLPLPRIGMGAFQQGGVATDEYDNPSSYQPARGGTTGMEATAPENAYQEGGVLPDPQQMQQTVMMSPQQLQDMFMQQYGGYGGSIAGAGMKKGGVPKSYEILEQIAKQNPPKGDAVGIPARYQDGGVTDKRPETGTYSENPKVITQLERVAPYYYATPTVAPYPPSMEDYLTKLGMLQRGQTPENMSFQGGGVAYGNMMFDPTQLSFAQQQQRQQSPQQRPQQPSPVAGEPSGPQPKQPQRFEFGPADYWYEYPQVMQALMDQQAPPIEKGQGPPAVAAKGGGVIPKEFMQYLAKGGLVKKDFTPHDHLMFALGGMYALSPKQAAKRLKDTANPMPP